MSWTKIDIKTSVRFIISILRFYLLFVQDKIGFVLLLQATAFICLNRAGECFVGVFSRLV